MSLSGRTESKLLIAAENPDEVRLHAVKTPNTFLFVAATANGIAINATTGSRLAPTMLRQASLHKRLVRTSRNPIATPKKASAIHAKTLSARVIDNRPSDAATPAEAISSWRGLVEASARAIQPSAKIKRIP